MKRFVFLLFIFGWALAAPLTPLTGIPVLPDNTVVKMISQDLTSNYATGIIRRNTLILTAENARLPANETVHLWIGVPNEETRSFKVVVSKDGKDCHLEIKGEKISFATLLREAYNVKLEWKAP